jgi:hypothetical protein
MMHAATLTTLPGDFLGAFRARRDYCAALLELSRGQAALIAGGDYEGLLSHLGQKQRLIDRMLSLSNGTAELWPRWRAARDGLDPELRGACEAVLKETEEFLAVLLAIDQSSAQELLRQREATQVELSAAAGARQAETGYDAASATSRYLDLGS